jgi:hypothetical protein
MEVTCVKVAEANMAAVKVTEAVDVMEAVEQFPKNIFQKSKIFQKKPK